MKVRSVRLVCFSPTGTSKAVLRGIAAGLGPDPVELIDITHPDARTDPLNTAEDELLVMAVPVYMGRVPARAAGMVTILIGSPPVPEPEAGANLVVSDLFHLAEVVVAAGDVSPETPLGRR